MYGEGISSSSLVRICGILNCNEPSGLRDIQPSIGFLNKISFL